VNQCLKVKANGEQCGARAVTPEGLCSIHGGLVDPAAIGRKGGQKTAGPGDQRALAKLVADNDDLRSMAQKVFKDALNSEIPSERLAAAKAIASVAPERPVPESQRKGWQTEYAGLPMADLAKELSQYIDGGIVKVLPTPGEIVAQAEALKKQKEES
jgi:hypothetical protein